MRVFCDLTIGLVTGFVSGALSSLVIYALTKRREQKYQTYNFCRSYLFDVLQHCEIYMPVEKIKQLSIVGEKDSAWGKAIYAIFDETRPFDSEDRELTNREARIAENVLVALNELEKWKKQNHLYQ